MLLSTCELEESVVMILQAISNLVERDLVKLMRSFIGFVEKISWDYSIYIYAMDDSYRIVSIGDRGGIAEIKDCYILEDVVKIICTNVFFNQAIQDAKQSGADDYRQQKKKLWSAFEKAKEQDRIKKLLQEH